MVIRWVAREDVILGGIPRSQGDVFDAEDRLAFIYLANGQAEPADLTIRTSDPVVESRDPKPPRRRR